MSKGHLFKIILGFAGMILIGLLGLFFTDQFNNSNQHPTATVSLPQ